MIGHWSTHQLTEYFIAVSRPTTERETLQVAVERVAESLEAEMAAVVMDGTVCAVVGFGSAKPPEELVRIAPGRAEVDVPMLGVMDVAAASMSSRMSSHSEEHAISGTLVTARSEGPFAPEEEQILQAMGTVLGLVIRNIRSLAVERARQQMMEHLLDLQRAISHRRPLQEVLDAVTCGTADLPGVSGAALVRLKESAPGGVELASFHPRQADTVQRIIVANRVLPTARSAMNSDTLVKVGPDGAATHAVPVYEHGVTAGALVVNTSARGELASVQEDLLTLFAHQVSIALTDADTVQRMREAFHDHVTGLPNRALFLERLEQALQRRSASGEPLTVLFVDLDRFKEVNDSLGHAAGDELLAEMGRRISSKLRSGDTAARLGGDEFAVLLEGSDAARSLSAAHHVVEALCRPVTIDRRQVLIGASVGIADTSSAVTGEDLLSQADTAMYQAKRSGSGRIVVFHPSMFEDAQQRLELASSLRNGIPDDELSVVFQPIMAIDTAKPVAVEALLRWSHPELGPVSPLTFIPLAEETGAIHDLGRRVLDRAVSLIKAWRRVQPGLRVNVNVSARQVADVNFVRDVAAILRRHDVPAEAVVLELTESVMFADPDLALARMAALRDLGVALSLDDFGTGFSSLSYLRSFTVDQVKIDRSFVGGLADEFAPATAKDHAVTRAVVRLGTELGMQTVAEGVEEVHQLNRMAELGCHLAQGWLIARPMDAEALTAWLLVHGEHVQIPGRRCAQPAASASGSSVGALTAGVKETVAVLPSTWC